MTPLEKRKKYRARTISGICVSCPLPAKKGSVRCETHMQKLRDTAKMKRSCLPTNCSVNRMGLEAFMEWEL